MNLLEYLKMLGSNEVFTGFKDKYNRLVDKVIYNATSNVDGTNGAIATFYTNVGEIEVSLENNEYSSTTFIYEGENYTNAISDLDRMLALLAPPRPGNLSTKSLDIYVDDTNTIGSYSAIQTKTGNTRTKITDDTTPYFQFNPVNNSTPSTNNGAFSSDLGSLSATITKDLDSANTVLATPQIPFTTSDETGSMVSVSGGISLTVDSDFDYHFGVAGKQGFWKAFFASIKTLSALTHYPNEAHKVEMTHSQTGTTTLVFYIDDPKTPIISNKAISTTALGTTKISGVPTLIINDPIKCEFTIKNAIQTFYTTGIANATSSITSSVTTTESGSKTYAQDYFATLTPVVQTNKYTENLVMTLNGYNSKYNYSATNSDSSLNYATTTADISTTQASKTMRVDTISNESARKKSGSGQYPTFASVGGTYDSDESLTVNEELQMIGGVYRYPYLNHTTNYPVAGDNYSTLTGWRYVTFAISITAKQNISITFNGATNFNSIANLDMTMNSSVWRLQVNVGGTTGWLDGNVAYTSGNPSGDGSAAMVVAASSATKKVVTFGTATLTGTCYIRIGLNNSAKSYPISFSSVTITAS